MSLGSFGKICKYNKTIREFNWSVDEWIGRRTGREGKWSKGGGEGAAQAGAEAGAELSLDMCAILMRQLNVVVVHSLCCCFFPVVCHKFFCFAFFFSFVLLL